MEKHENYLIQSQNVPPTGMHTQALGPYLDQVGYGQRLHNLGTDLLRSWEEQQNYNRAIMVEHGTEDPSEWTQTYLMGLVSEIDEVLRELHWKRHRRGSGRVIESNLARELADLTKFVLSLWQVWGFSPEQMLNYVREKNEVLNFQWYQDQDRPMPHTATILFDLDGTVANYREGLVEYLRKHAGVEGDHRTVFYQMDLATGMDYNDYHEHKDRFEEQGGYRELPPIKDAVQALKLMGDRVNLCAVTARPKYLSRSWADTFYWLKHHVRQPDRLWLAGGERLRIAKDLRDQGYNVVCWEDAPVEALRFAEHGFQVWMRATDYNEGMAHKNIHRIQKFTPDPRHYFGEGF